MITVLDQYEVEYKETYISGSYDQVVMGKMFYEIKEKGVKKYVYGDRGVVYGSINSNTAPVPGTGKFDSTSYVSYRLQPYKEKAGNIRAAKHLCYEERIYDTLLPDPITCFKLNGAEPGILTGSFVQHPGLIATKQVVTPRSAIDGKSIAILMFDNYTKDSTRNRWVLNPIVDRRWMRAFPFEPRYSKIQKKATHNFSNIIPKYEVVFSGSQSTSGDAKLTSLSAVRQPPQNGILFGTIGPRLSSRANYSNNVDLESGIFHHWFAEVNLSRKIDVQQTQSPYPTTTELQYVTESLGYNDTIKVLFGFGDGISTYYDTKFSDPADPTGYNRRGTNNLPTFRQVAQTTYSSFYTPTGPLGIKPYEYQTGSLWCVSPVIRGWKYGIYNGLPDYTNVYYRQGRYGQFRDMLEQRVYTTVFDEKTNALKEAAVKVKFLDQDENLTNPANTDSQNLSSFATSSLPFFDLTQRNRPENTLKTNNLSLVKLNFDVNANLII
jgi:hypothetical protein